MKYKNQNFPEDKKVEENVEENDEENVEKMMMKKMIVLSPRKLTKV